MFTKKPDIYYVVLNTYEHHKTIPKNALITHSKLHIKNVLPT